MDYKKFAYLYQLPKDFKKVDDPTVLTDYMSACITLGDSSFRLVTMSKDLFITFGMMTDETKARLLAGLSKECEIAQKDGGVFTLKHPNGSGAIVVTRIEHDTEHLLHAELR